jgi:macrolide-specific efflux system membrane fusion protein
MRRSVRFWTASACVVIVSVASLTLYATRKESPHLITVPARISAIEQAVLATGVIEPMKLVSVGAQASGRIEALHVELGDRVTKGQLIAEIDPSAERNALQIAQAGLRQIRAERRSRIAASRLAELALSRTKRTYSAAASSQADYETAEANCEEAKADVAVLDAQIRQATLQVDNARVTLNYTKVVAPMDGVVVAIVAPAGQTVNAVQTAPTIVKLANLDVMTVKAQISEADVTRVYPGQKVYFTILGAPEHRYRAQLRAVEPAPDSLAVDSASTVNHASGSGANSAVYYNGLFEIPNTDHLLRPSMTAQVYIILRDSDDALTIPASALRARLSDDSYSVAVVDAQGRTTERRIKIGINNNVSVEVLSGLKAGEEIVVEGQISSSANPTQRSQ